MTAGRETPRSTTAEFADFTPDFAFALCPNDAGDDHRWGWQDGGDLFWLHRCRREDNGARWWSTGGIDVTTGQRHRLVSRDPLTVEASVLCVACGDHGWFREGRWVRA